MNESALPPAIRYDHGITCLDTLQERPGMAACYLLERGDDLAFVEAGTSPGVPRLLAWLDANGLARERVRYIIPTHVHLDHAGGVGSLAAALPNADVIAHPRGARHLVDPTQLIAGATAVYGEAFVRATYGLIPPIPPRRVREAPDGTKLPFGAGALQFIDTPGHAKHHFCIFDPVSEGLFTGDTFGLSYRNFDTERGPFLIPTTTPIQFDPAAWHATLDRLLSLQPQRLFLTHFGQVEAVTQLAAVLRAGIDRYVALAQQAPAGESRHQWLRDALEQDTLSALQRHGCTLSHEESRRLLAVDLELNAQGLGVWLDRAA